MAWRLAATKRAMDNPDLSYWQTDIALISLLELWLGIIVACIPTLAPLAKTYIKPAVSKLRSLSYGSRHTAKQISLDNLGSSANQTTRASRRYHVMGDDDHPLVLGGESGMPGMAITTEISSVPMKDDASDLTKSTKTITVQHDIQHH
jgi:hypothetical protein